MCNLLKKKGLTPPHMFYMFTLVQGALRVFVLYSTDPASDPFKPVFFI